jgi:transposase
VSPKSQVETIEAAAVMLNQAADIIDSLVGRIERLSELVPDTAAATAARKAARNERAEFAKALRAQGLTHTKIAEQVKHADGTHVDVRTVQRYLKSPKA